jgi:hypothetical protein
VQPAAPNLKVPIATVIHAHPSNGTLFVRPSHFPDLNQINDVQLTSPTTGQTLIYNASTGVWSNQTPADPSSTNELQTLSVATNTATLSNGGGSVTIAGGGINTVGTAGTTITVTGTEVDGSVSNELQTLSTGTNTLTLSNGGGTVTVDTDPGSDITGSGVSARVPYFNGTQTVTSSSNFQYENVANGRLSIGGPSIIGAAGFGNLSLYSTGGSVFYQDSYNATGGVTNYWFVRKSKGSTIGSLLTTENDDFLGALYFQGVNNINQFEYGAQIFARQFGSAGAFIPTRLNFFTYSATGRNTNQFILQPDGGASFGTDLSSARIRVHGSGSTSTTWTAQFHNSATGGNNALMIRDDGNVGIGTSSPTDPLTVSGRINQIGIGESIFIGQGAGRVDDLSTNRNVFLGFQAGFSNTSGENNVFEGHQAGYLNTTGSSNFFQGTTAGYSNTSGAGNIFQGRQAGYFNTTGLLNLFQGLQAGYLNTTGSYNVFQGYNTGYNNTIGEYNLFQGVGAGNNNKTGSNNIFQGSSAGSSNISGNRNVFNGSSSAFSTVRGSNNVAVGFEAGRYISTGTTGNTRIDNSIFIGYQTRALDTAQTNQIVIGYNVVGLGSNTTRIGNSVTTQTHLDGSLTLGDATLDASAVLDISSTTRGVLFPRMTTAQRDLITTPADGLVIYNTTTNKLQVRAAGVWVDLH